MRIFPTTPIKDSEFLLAQSEDLRPVADVGLARRALDRYEPPSPEQARIRTEILSFIYQHPENAHLRSCVVGHLTASALVHEQESRQVLLTHHRKLDRWLQLGGHCDGDANLAAVALREAEEESGIEGLRVLPKVIDLDIHLIPARGSEAAHYHFDCRFLVIAPRALPFSVSHESKALRWLTRADARALTDDKSVHRLLDLAV